jgi:hypothetical protein
VSVRDAAEALGVATMTYWDWENQRDPKSRADRIRFREFLERLEAVAP